MWLWLLAWCAIWGLLTMQVGRTKVGSDRSWFVYGALFGPVGLAIAVFAKDQPDQPA